MGERHSSGSPSGVPRALNPVIRGFNPDPTILRVGDDYYVATSTFEWYPGIRIHHSRDLVNWQVLGHALDASNGLDLRGIPDSGGVWAPSLTFADGVFWMAYSVVRTMDGDNKDLENFLVTASEPSGPWSKPISLGSRGFDFSFFHDEGRHWIVGVQWDHRPGCQRFSGIVLEEYFADTKRVSGEPIQIYRQDALVEGPNLYRIGGEYHLLLAEGGTGWNHGITSARSASLEGPYLRDPRPAVLTTRDSPGLPLQKAGHGELVQLPAGEWMLVHLASRPVLVLGERYSTLGRETCLQRVEFDRDGWIRLVGGGHHPANEIEVDRVVHSDGPTPARDDFDTPVLNRLRWSTLRGAADSNIELEARTGWLRLRGAQSTSSVFEQAMIAQRVEEHSCTVTTKIDANPRTSRHAAGVVAWYNRDAWIWLQITFAPDLGRHLRIVRRTAGHTEYASDAIGVPDGETHLRLRIDDATLTAHWSADGSTWLRIGGEQPFWTLSDDHGDRLRFTGSFVGVRTEDLDGDGWHADYDYVTVEAQRPVA